MLVATCAGAVTGSFGTYHLADLPDVDAGTVAVREGRPLVAERPASRAKGARANHPRKARKKETVLAQNLKSSSSTYL